MINWPLVIWQRHLRDTNYIYHQVSNIRRLSRQQNCRSLRCSWSIASRHCYNYIFILDLTHGFIGLGKDNCETRRETFKFGDLVRLIFGILRYSASNYARCCHEKFHERVGTHYRFGPFCGDCIFKRIAFFNFIYLQKRWCGNIDTLYA